MRATHRAILFEALESRQLLYAGGTGLEATYFNTQSFTGTQASRVDAQVNFNFGSKSPAPGISATTYTVRWTGQIKPAFSEQYTFTLKSDDGVRLWINHQRVISDWGQSGLSTSSGQITLIAGKKYDIQLEYRQKTGTAAVQLFWSSPSMPQALVPKSRLFPAAQNLNDKIDHAIAYAQSSLQQTLADMNGSTANFPSITSSAGPWTFVNLRDWTSGFFAGSLWQMYQRTLTKSWRLSAQSLTEALAAGTNQPDDAGFRFLPSTLPLYQTLGRASDKQDLINAAASMVATFNPKVGMFQTLDTIPSHSGNPNANFMVVLDEMMCVNLVYYAGKLTNNQAWINMANSHVSKMIQTMIRPDGGTYQLGYYNSSTGAFVDGEAKQGLNDASTWSRGQAWAIYSLTDAYAETGRADFLAAAKKTADYYIAHLPADDVPYWDFNAKVTSTTPRDSSAAAVAASALLKLASLLSGTTDGARYKAAAEGTLNSLTSSTYLAEGSTSHGILLHGAKWVAKGMTDNSLVYGDYYFLEALNRYATLKF
ncbi:MAG TPA: PA14 domain-containing protein [Tepidisphaeraceae bacterium]|jgi:unsaturated chondroitin disaccharide hydrolase|nr:PA14 domain-containing protein [Tepidisphaeraceae bacterium]